MDEKIRVFLTKYFETLVFAVGKENDGLRAKIAWFLAQEFLTRFDNLPVNFIELQSSLKQYFDISLPFAGDIQIRYNKQTLIEVEVDQCCLVEANRKVVYRHGFSICPISPLLVFSFSRGLNTNCSLFSVKEKDGGCLMQFAIGKTVSNSRKRLG